MIISSQCKAFESAPVSTLASKSKSSKSSMDILSFFPTIFFSMGYPLEVFKIISQFRVKLFVC